MRRSTGRRRLSHALLALGVVAGGLAVLQGVEGTASADAQWAVTKSVDAKRVFYDEDGQVDTAATTTNHVTVKVSTVTSLRGRQEVTVAWSGAHPTGGVVQDATSEVAKEQEYPVVVLQCRGVDANRTLSPETCWTQNASERYFASASQVPVWRADAYATARDRGPVVGAPSVLPEGCSGLSVPTTARWLPLKAADGTTYFGGPDPGVGCIKTAPEASDTSDVGLPSNTTYGKTDADGNGQTDFAVWTRAENATIGCSATVACSLVVVPVVGLSCDAWGTQLKEPQVSSTGAPLTSTNKTNANNACRRTGSYAPGESRDSTRSSDSAVRGSYWWSASNWRNRVSVPLDFAPTGDACSAVSSGPDLEVGGSVVLNELAASWRPAFCTSGSLFPFTHVQQADFFALRQVEAGSLAVGFASEPPEGGFSGPVVPAPVTVGGFAIAFSIDDASGRRQDSLRLNARLVAKLLTESYPTTTWLRADRSDLKDNPLNITTDPEFQALNPGLPVDQSLDAGATLQLLSERADLVEALAQWVDADPEARAWIDGKPDPWGMRVNKNFTGITLADQPTFLRDDYIAPDWYQKANVCYGNSPSPFLNLVANPQPNLNAITVAMQFASSSVLTTCNFKTEDPVGSLPLKKEGKQSVGRRFVLGLVSLSSAARYNLRTASLQTTSTVPASSTFTSAAGRTFVPGSTAGLRAGAALLKPDASHVWTLDYAQLHTSRGAKAYPGTLPVYAAVPTTGLSAPSATQAAKLLCYAVDPRRGLRQGPSNGELPAGYLPLTASNGLGAQRDYTLQAVSAIRNQTKSVPALSAKPLSYDDVCDFREQAVLAPGASTGPSSSGSDGSGVTPSTDDAPASNAPATSASTQAGVARDVVLTKAPSSGFGSLGLPFLILLAVLAGLAGSVLRWLEPLTYAGRELRAAAVKDLRRGVAALRRRS